MNCTKSCQFQRILYALLITIIHLNVILQLYFEYIHRCLHKGNRRNGKTTDVDWTRLQMPGTNICQGQRNHHNLFCQYTIRWKIQGLKKNAITSARIRPDDLAKLFDLLDNTIIVIIEKTTCKLSTPTHHSLSLTN